MLFETERMIRAMSGGELRECAEWLVRELESGENPDAEKRQTFDLEYLFSPARGYQAVTPGELALAEQFTRRAEEQAARDAERERLDDEEDLRRLRQMWLAMGGKDETDREAEDASPESAGARVSAQAGESGGRAPGMEEISEFFRRDSRRYDGGFVRY